MSEHDLNQDGTNNCPIVEELLSPFIDDELNATADEFVRHHLDSCAACMKSLDELKATVDAINGLPTEATPEHDLWPGIVAASSDGSLGSPSGVGRERRWRIPKPMLLAAGLAVLLVPAGVFAGMSLLRDNDEPVIDGRHLVREERDRARERDLDRSLAGIEEWAEQFAREWESAAEQWAEQWERDYEGTANEHRLDALLSALADDDPRIRRTVARTLGKYDNPHVVMALSGALQEDDDDDVRRWAAWALGEIGDARAVPALIQCLTRDSYAEARRWAAWALGEIESPQAVEALVHAVQRDSYAAARRWAAWALGEIESPQAVEGLSHALLNDSQWEVRRWAAWALGEIEDPSAAEALSIALQNDDNAEVRRWAIWALGELEHR